MVQQFPGGGGYGMEQHTADHPGGYEDQTGQWIADGGGYEDEHGQWVGNPEQLAETPSRVRPYPGRRMRKRTKEKRAGNKTKEAPSEGVPQVEPRERAMPEPELEPEPALQPGSADPAVSVAISEAEEDPDDDWWRDAQATADGRSNMSDMAGGASRRFNNAAAKAGIGVTAGDVVGLAGQVALQGVLELVSSYDGNPVRTVGKFAALKLGKAVLSGSLRNPMRDGGGGGREEQPWKAAGMCIVCEGSCSGDSAEMLFCSNLYSSSFCQLTSRPDGHLCFDCLRYRRDESEAIFMRGVRGNWFCADCEQERQEEHEKELYETGPVACLEQLEAAARRRRLRLQQMEAVVAALERAIDYSEVEPDIALTLAVFPNGTHIKRPITGGIQSGMFHHGVCIVPDAEFPTGSVVHFSDGNSWTPRAD